MMEWLRKQGETMLGIFLVLIVAVGTIVMAPVVAQQLERVPWLIYMYTGGAPLQKQERESVDPLPFATAGLTTEELVELGLPAASGPIFNEVERDTIFPSGHVVTDSANEQMVLSARRALWKWDTGTPGFGTEIMIVELPTREWAEVLGNIWAFEPPASSNYPKGATQAFESGQLEGEEFEVAKVQFIHDRLWVVVQLGTSQAYASAVAAGTSERLNTSDLSRQMALAIDTNLPDLDDLEGWESLQTEDLRLLNASSLGVAAVLTILARAIGAGILDRGSREAISGLTRRRVPFQREDVILTQAVRQKRVQLFVRTFVLAISSGIGLIALYFISGSMELIPMFLIAGLLILAGTLVVTFLHRRSPDEELGGRWLLAEALATALSTTVVVAGIFFVGTAGIGFTMGNGQLVRTLSLVMLVLGLAVVGFAHYPAQFFRRLAMPAIKRTLERDKRAPVLFLRSFQDDDLWVRIHPSSRPSPAMRLALLNDSTFEDLIAWQSARVGPVIAIGQPGTRLQPLGAVRDYFSDDEWQTAVLRRINIASAVVFVVGRSPGAQWELAQLRERGALGKTVFVFPPVPEKEFEKRCFVLCTGLGLHPLTLNSNIAKGMRLVAMRIGSTGEIVRYFADSRDDIAYKIALEKGLAEAVAVRTVIRTPAGARADLADATKAKTLLASYDPTRKPVRSSDPFRRALGFFLNITN
ncbi:hypothetical protein CQ018_10660 [Arthrobacter sp. MYb227]|uniref:hypothetical protein n=1 Tax=Arthrobacter sp. MYb227 TaxID=1848601 RepID=UPI000CFC946A|nr:hypothetical protein [Arthrobacter sp. MYb227]PQZ92924.1 hypothetical protein CQ018_10660 [Arthrobacter sp. MYb227]